MSSRSSFCSPIAFHGRGRQPLYARCLTPVLSPNRLRSLVFLIMSNGIFKSPVHRVVENAEKERTSIAMFYGLDPEKEIEPAADLLHEKQPTRYRKVKTKDYMAGFYEHFRRGTRSIDSVKI